ncbi:MAG: hypothetical protein WCA12_10030 [Burkholderiales bacterium]
MKSERVTLLTTPEFKAFLAAEAKRENVSMAELVRSRCEQRPGDDEAVFADLTAELRVAVADAKKSLRRGLAEAEAVLKELRSKRAGNVAPRRAGKPRAKAAA